MPDNDLSRVDAALADLLTSERAFLHPIPEDSRRALAGLLRDLLAPLDAEQPDGGRGRRTADG